MLFKKIFFSLIVMLLSVGIVSCRQPSTKQSVEAALSGGSIYYQNKVMVLMYHSISDQKSSIALSPTVFNEQMDALANYGYNVISMAQFIDWIRNGTSIPPNAVVLTFDDGYEDFYTTAFPILKKHGYPATNFIIVGTIGNRIPNDTHRRLTWEQMRTMMKYGMSFYSHTFNQHHLENTTASGDPKPMLTQPIYLKKEHRVETESEYEVRITHDLMLANEEIHKELGENSDILAFPYGAYNSTVIRIANSLGIHYFFSITGGINDRTQAEKMIYRVNMGSPDTTLEKFLWRLKYYRTHVVHAKGE
jgi:biofilm PGA synthesis lipoprotein PgaB